MICLKDGENQGGTLVTTVVSLSIQEADILSLRTIEERQWEQANNLMTLKLARTVLSSPDDLTVQNFAFYQSARSTGKLPFSAFSPEDTFSCKSVFEKIIPQQEALFTQHWQNHYHEL